MNFQCLQIFAIVLIPIFVGFPPKRAEAYNAVTTYSSPTATTGGTYYCARCGRYHAIPQSNSNGVMQTGYRPGDTTTGLRGGGGVQNVLTTLNAQRARQGVGALSYDPNLQAVAERRAQTMASMRIKSHPPGSFAPGRYEGVGWSSSFSPSGVSACYTSSPNMRYAGAAMATGSDGVYFAVVYR